MAALAALHRPTPDHSPFQPRPAAPAASANSPTMQGLLGSLDASHPLLQVLQLAAAAASLPAPSAPQHFGAAPAHAAPAGPLQLTALQPAAGPPITATSGTSSERFTRQQADATAELEPLPNSVAGVKLPVTCNDIRGLVYLDQQVVACYCPTCEQRVAGGHGRPLFSFTRFERHSGSKAKKWRLSIRIDPGAVQEAAPDEPPLALGAWLESKGLVSWAPRGGLKIGPSNMGGSSDEEGSPLFGDDGGNARRALGGGDRRQGTIGPRGGGAEGFVPFAAAAAAAAAAVGMKRGRQEYDTPDLAAHADRARWLQAQRDAFEAVAAACPALAAAPPSPAAREQPAAPAAGQQAEAAGGDAPKNGGAAPTVRPGAAPAAAAGTIAKHAAIFSLVYGLLDEGDDRRAFNEHYLPFLNSDLTAHRLDAEFATLLSYLRLLDGGMAPEAARAQMAAYVRAVAARAAGGAPPPSPAAPAER